VDGFHQNGEPKITHFVAAEKREPVSDIDTAAADSLKVLDPERPIREADIEPDF
jgi:hypothetical protein